MTHNDYVSTGINSKLMPLLDKLVRETRDEYGLLIFRSRSDATAHAIKDFLRNHSEIGPPDRRSRFDAILDSCNSIKYVEKLSLGDHAILFYYDEIVKRLVSIPFLRSGMRRGIAVVYLASERRMDRVAKEMRRGMDVEELEEY